MWPGKNLWYSSSLLIQLCEYYCINLTHCTSGTVVLWENMTVYGTGKWSWIELVIFQMIFRYGALLAAAIIEVLSISISCILIVHSIVPWISSNFACVVGMIWEDKSVFIIWCFFYHMVKFKRYGSEHQFKRYLFVT